MQTRTRIRRFGVEAAPRGVAKRSGGERKKAEKCNKARDCREELSNVRQDSIRVSKERSHHGNPNTHM